MINTAHPTKAIFFLCMFIASSITPLISSYPLYTDKYVNDTANILTKDHQKNIKNVLSTLDRTTGAEISVVTIDSFGKLAELWGRDVGKTGTQFQEGIHNPIFDAAKNAAQKDTWSGFP